MSDEDYEDERPRRRENIMQQRLRKARGEEIDEDLAADLYSDDDDEPPRGFAPMRSRGGYSSPPASSGCATSTLYLVIGGLIALLIVIFFVNQTIGGIGQIFGQAPDLRQLVNTPTPQIRSGAAVIQRIQQLSRLETASYTIERVIDVSQGSNIPILGDDKLLLIAHGSVVAGVDLSQLNEDSLKISPDGSTLTLSLPPAQIFSSNLDSQKTRVYSRERGWLAPENKDLETQARQEAEQQILQAACEDGILERATQEAERSLRQFVGLLEYDKVEISTSPPGACVAPANAP